MRLWSLHPSYLDRAGLIALWRESLLAQKVLLGKTRGYRHHPQLERFKTSDDPPGAIGAYLVYIAKQATERGYNFDTTKIAVTTSRISEIPISSGQIEYEFSHLMKKLTTRDPEQFTKNRDVTVIQLHPIFRRIRGGVADWEKVVK